MRILNNINFTILVAALFFTSLNLYADSSKGFKKNSQNLMIEVNSRGCVSHVELVSVEDNCAGSNLANSCGKKVKDCVCMTSQKFISWKTSNNSPFELVFTGAKPFKPGCDLKSKNKKEIKCKIGPHDGEFIYDVVIKSCPEQSYDPRIVVRN